MRFRHLPCGRSQPAAFWWRYVAQALLTLLLVSAASTLLWSQPAYAADLIVDGTNCTLVEAITAANNDNAAGNGCMSGSGADTITLLGDVALSAVDNEMNGLPVISSAITIAGNNHTISRTSAAPAFRFFNVAANGTLTLNQITLTGGNSTYGGAILNGNGGTVTVNNSTLAANAATVSAGAIGNYGTMTVNNSTLSANTAASNAGAIENYGMVTVNNSALTGNTAARGGAIRNFATMTVNNSTLSANAVTGNGGAILNDSTLTLNNSTLVTNTAAAGGGIYTFGALNLVRSLIAGNNATSSAPEIYRSIGTINANNYNLIGYGGSARSRDFTPGANDLVPAVPLAAILNSEW